MSSLNVYAIGQVAWFGGIDSTSGHERKYGFINTLKRESVYIHKQSLLNADQLNEGDWVICQLNSQERGTSADRVMVIKPLMKAETAIKSDNKFVYGKEDVMAAIISYVAQNKSLEDICQSQSLLHLIKPLFDSKCHGDNFFISAVNNNIPTDQLLALARKCARREEIISLLVKNLEFLEVVNNVEVSLWPTCFLDDNILACSNYLLNCTSDTRVDFLKNTKHLLSFNSVLFLLFRKAISSLDFWGEDLESKYRTMGVNFGGLGVIHRIVKGNDKIKEPNKMERRLHNFIRNIVLQKKDESIVDVVREAYREHYPKFSDFCNDDFFGPLILPLLVKRKMYLKDMSFVEDVNRNPAIRNNPEFWFLTLSLPLFFAGNSNGDVAKIVQHELWVALIGKRFDIDDPSFFKLFPECEAMKKQYPHMRLSCEAFHWKIGPEKQVYICRSKRCYTPRVTPNLSKCYLDYSAFDWLLHYGVSYENESAPSKKDFPIKMAGYFNRIRELRARLHCRRCNKLMVPDMAYARTETIDFKRLDPDGNPVLVSMKAAYRLTVFKCNNDACKGHGVNYYMNHCVKYNCYKIIDSRDLQKQCANGWYICSACGSCCPEHSDISSPAGVNANQSLKHKKLYDL